MNKKIGIIHLPGMEGIFRNVDFILIFSGQTPKWKKKKKPKIIF